MECESTHANNANNNAQQAIRGSKPDCRNKEKDIHGPLHCSEWVSPLNLSLVNIYINSMLKYRNVSTATINPKSQYVYITARTH